MGRIRRIIGYTLLVLCCLLWLAILVIPFLGLKGGWIVGLTTGLIIAGEVTFYLGILLLGKEVWQKIKSWFKRKKKTEETEEDKTDNL